MLIGIVFLLFVANVILLFGLKKMNIVIRILHDLYVYYNDEVEQNEVTEEHDEMSEYEIFLDSLKNDVYAAEMPKHVPRAMNEVYDIPEDEPLPSPRGVIEDEGVEIITGKYEKEMEEKGDV